MLQRKASDDEKRATKQQVTKAGKAIKEQRVEPQPYMRRADWRDHQVIEDITLLDGLTLHEQASTPCLLDRPYIPPSMGLQIVRTLAEATPEHH